MGLETTQAVPVFRDDLLR